MARRWSTLSQRRPVPKNDRAILGAALNHGRCNARRYFLAGFGVGVGEALLEVTVGADVELEADFCGEIVDVAFVWLTPPTRSGEIFRGVGLGGATGGGEAAPRNSPFAARAIAPMHRLYFCAQSCMQPAYAPGADEARALH